MTREWNEAIETAARELERYADLAARIRALKRAPLSSNEHYRNGLKAILPDPENGRKGSGNGP